MGIPPSAHPPYPPFLARQSTELPMGMFVHRNAIASAARAPENALLTSAGGRKKSPAVGVLLNPRSRCHIRTPATNGNSEAFV